MASVNMAIVVGFVGDTPRINTLQSGRKVASFSMATTEKGYTNQSGQQIPDKTEWHNIVCWGKTAEVVERFVHKGSQLYIQGKMRTRTYEKDGQTRYTFEIECETLQLLDRRNDGQQNPYPIPAELKTREAVNQFQQQYMQQPQPQQPKNSWDEPIEPIGDLPF